ncbi:related to chromosome condensation protein (CrcB) [Phialocephala subalpina]|uniref:Related to chromosome condensation protein (CrcB) n=1 Tax=Phialocephala subalpina TaxID=576137 RepID=A0A1L7XXG4_9HELO|nr:related to chromosome condensation protein (CrcB) [Phialocephala subalpina]
MENRSGDMYSLSVGNRHLNELAAPGPVETLSHYGGQGSERNLRRSSNGDESQDEFMNLNELAAPSPVDNPEEHHRYRHEFLEEQHLEENRESIGLRNFIDLEQSKELPPAPPEFAPGIQSDQRPGVTAKIVLELSILSYLILFSILGALARLGLQVLTSYPGAPIPTSVVWANVGGSLIMGYLSEDRQLFKMHIRREDLSSGLKAESSEDSSNTATPPNQDRSYDSGTPEEIQTRDAKDHMTRKKTIPLYIGLTTGFCGSFTSFSSFIRDVFLQLANQPLAVKSRIEVSEDIVRGGGENTMAVIAIIFLTVGLCISALKIGAHLAIILGNIDGSLPSWLTSKVFDRFIVLSASCVWIGAIIMAVWPPDDKWRGQVLFAIIFAPVGTILRFYASVHLNGVIASFPLGTFSVNVFGTAVLGMSWDLQRASFGGMVGGGKIGCQVLQGVQDGFCGCLTTVSTWVLELVGLKRMHAYVYGGLSTAISLAFLVVIMGTLLWSRGFESPACVL